MPPLGWIVPIDAAVASPQSIEAVKLAVVFPRSLAVNVATTTSFRAWPSAAVMVEAVPVGGSAGLVTLMVWKFV